MKLATRPSSRPLIEEARSFAVTLMNAGRQAAAIEASRPGQIEAAKKQVAASEANIGPREQARGRLSDVEHDEALLGAIQSAEARVASATAAVEQRAHGPVAAPAASEGAA